jgi:phosphatidylglycerol:prolipoprotein diacylglycerol transferase
MFEFPLIDPVAFSVGPLAVRWYALAYLAGFLLGWRYCLYLAGLDKDSRPSKQDIEDFLPWVIVGVILGGRIGYVLFYQFELYAQYPLEALKIWRGGMSFHGGALGVIIALIVYPLVKKFNQFRLADMVCAAVPIGLFFGRIANFINGELYGRATESPLGIVFPHGGEFPRHPSQLYEAALEGAVLFVILFALIRCKLVREKPGIVSGVFLAGYGLFRAFVEFFREPDEHIGYLFEVFSMGQMLSLPMILGGLGLVGFALMGKTGGEPVCQNKDA